ncbi:MAG: hypothetical protein BGO49_27170 [Planctomycetales bacterium 71-10]|nr:MAG: hypothetical protein BGO49_27170 [Planctomycetales bacterium 71-10]
MRRPAVYERASRGDTSGQLAELLEWAGRQPEPLAWFRDEGSTLDERPGLRSLLRAVAAGQVSYVVVWRLDRLYRSVPELVGMVRLLGRLRVGLVSLRDRFDSETESGRETFRRLAEIAASEGARR